MSKNQIIPIILLYLLLQGITMSRLAITVSKKVLLFLLISFIVTSTISTTIFNTNFGTVSVTNISIVDNSNILSGTLYKPNMASKDNIMPAVVCLHGFMNSKTTMSGIALELSRRGFVTLALDAIGHGNSEGALRKDNPTLGLLAAVNYVRSLEYVDSNLIGLVGHSMGAAAVRNAVFLDKNISATVLIGGGVSTLGNSNYGTMNNTFPKNLLIAIGKYDQFFPDLETLKQDLKPIFGLNDEQELFENYAYYGSFEIQNARRLVISETIHLLEPVDNRIVSEIVSWMHNSLKSPDSEIVIPFNNQIYLYREFLILSTTLAISAFIILLAIYIYNSIEDNTSSFTTKAISKDLKPMKWYLVMAIWGTLSIALFLPLSVLGSIINFPPIILGSSLFWWSLGVSLLGFIVLLYLNNSHLKDRLNAKTVKKFLMQKETRFVLSTSLIIFLALYLFSSLYEFVFNLDLHFVIPLLNDLLPLNRVVIFLLFVPAFIVYFFIENLYFNIIFDGQAEIGHSSLNLTLLGKQLLAKTIPYVAILLVVYLPSFIFGVHLVQGTMFPLVIQLLWVIIPLFWLFTIISWWLLSRTSNITTAVVLNSLLISWLLAAILPFGSLPF